MSVEFLLFVLFLVAVPLLEFVMRLARGNANRPQQRSGQMPMPAPQRPHTRQQPSLPSSSQRPPGQLTPLPGRVVTPPKVTETAPATKVPAPPPQEGAREAAPQSVSLEGKSLENIGLEAAAPTTPLVSRPRTGPTKARPPRAAVVGTPAELRRAIVLATILGPCKAMEDIGARDSGLAARGPRQSDLSVDPARYL